MTKVTITRAGGYDPAKGPDHPDNLDPTLEGNAARERALAAGKTLPMRIGASMPVRMLREAYEDAYDDAISRFNLRESKQETGARRRNAIAAGERAALTIGRNLFPDRDGDTSDMIAERDRKVIVIAKKQATLRGWSDTGLSFHEVPCEACKGDGYRSDRHVMHEPCDLCDGDGFAPPVRQPAPYIAGLALTNKRPSALIPLDVAAYDFDVEISLSSGRVVEGEATLVWDGGRWNGADLLSERYHQTHGWLHGMPLRDYLRTISEDKQTTLAAMIAAMRKDPP